MHILVLGDPPCFFGAKMSILGNIFDKVQEWRLTIPQLGGIWKIKNVSVNH